MSQSFWPIRLKLSSAHKKISLPVYFFNFFFQREIKRDFKKLRKNDTVHFNCPHFFLLGSRRTPFQVLNLKKNSGQYVISLFMCQLKYIVTLVATRTDWFQPCAMLLSDIETELKSFGLKLLCSVHSIHSQWKSKQILATCMPHMCIAFYSAQDGHLFRF